MYFKATLELNQIFYQRAVTLFSFGIAFRHNISVCLMLM